MSVFAHILSTINVYNLYFRYVVFPVEYLGMIK